MLVRILEAAKRMQQEMRCKYHSDLAHEKVATSITLVPIVGVLSMHKKVIECPGYTAALTVDVASAGQYSSMLFISTLSFDVLTAQETLTSITGHSS